MTTINTLARMSLVFVVALVAMCIVTGLAADALRATRAYLQDFAHTYRLMRPSSSRWTALRIAWRTTRN